MSRLLSLLNRSVKSIREEAIGFHPRLVALNLAGAVLNRGDAASQTRARLMVRSGFDIGEGTAFVEVPRLSGRAGLVDRLHVGRHCYVDVECIFDLEERITLEDKVTIGPGVMILTSTHELSSAVHRAGPVTRAPVTIREGAWLRARSIVLPGVTVGEGAIVEAGAVVNKDVAPHCRVGGIPATQLEVLGGERT
jgi:maltose O-acetyltransferase